MPRPDGAPLSLRVHDAVIRSPSPRVRLSPTQALELARGVAGASGTADRPPAADRDADRSTTTGETS